MIFSDLEGRYMLSFFLASGVASFGSGYQFQAMFYLLILLLGGFGVEYEKWLGLSTLFIATVLLSGYIRSTAGGKK